MASWHTKRLRAKLVTCSFPAEQAEVAQAQIADIVDFHVASFSVTKDIQEQMRAVAFDCYVQGLLDGNQVRPVVDAMRNDAAGELIVTELPGGGCVSTVRGRADAKE